MLTFALQVVLLLLILGGAIAYVGNRVGRYIGRRRLTIFNLRPRYTAATITVISGVLIALSTAAVLLRFPGRPHRPAGAGKTEAGDRPEELRTAVADEALSNLNRELAQKKQQQQELEQQLTASRQETIGLQRARQKLSREVTVAREGQLLFRKGGTISISLIQAGPDKGKIDAGLMQIINSADDSLREMGIRSEKPLISVAPEEIDAAAYTLLSEDKIYVVKMLADRNAVWGEEVPARFELIENKLVYPEGAEIAGTDLSAGLSAAQIEQEIIKVLKLSDQAARVAGIQPDPSGSIGSIPYSQIADLAKKIKSMNKRVNLKVQAKKDTYAIGPLQVDLKLSGK